MSEMSRNARRMMRAKAHRLATAKTGKVDCSSYGPEENLEANIKTGMRPVSRRAYKAGGKVEGEKAKQHAGRMPRKSGGKTFANDMVNCNDKDANEEREGIKHVGGLKSGGRAKRAMGGNAGDEVPTGLLPSAPNRSRLAQAAGLKKGGAAKHSDEKEDRALVDKMVRKSALTGKEKGGSVSDGEMQGTRPTGGRLARKEGGGNWIKGAVKHPGALHKELDVPEGKKIPAKKLEKAEHSDNPKLAKRARLAETLKRMNRAEGGRTKGTNVNIIIGRSAPTTPPMGAPAPGAPGSQPVPVPVGPAGLGAVGPQIPGGPPPVGAPAPMGVPPMPMPRKSGGRANSYANMDAGAGSGEGRLEKTAIEKHKRK